MAISDPYAGPEGDKRKREEEHQQSGAVRRNALAERRDLLFRLPAGRALDYDDLHDLIDEGNQTSRGRLLRKAILTVFCRQLPPGILLMPSELELVRAHAAKHPTRVGPAAGVREWPEDGR